MNGRLLSIAATGFCCTVISAQWWPQLPVISWQLVLLVILFPTTIGAIASYSKTKPMQNTYCCLAIASFGAIAGLLMAASLGQSYQKWQQQGGEIQQDVIIEGRIVGLKHFADYQRLLLRQLKVDRLPYGNASSVLLYYYRPSKKFAVGQIIKARVRIKPARAVANPHGFDMQKWFVSQWIVKTGYVRGQQIQLLKPDVSVRGVLQNKLLQLQLPGERWLNALLFGERQGFSSEDWQILQNTGTAHLFAISGLHLMIVAGVVHFLLKGLWGTFGQFFGLPPSSKLLSMVLTVLSCGFYAYLAGWQIAVVRALSLVVLVAAWYLFNSRHSRVTLLVMALFLSIVIEPMAIYGVALYLSVGAVAILIGFHWWWTGRKHLPGWQNFVVMQVVLCMLMMPLVGGLMGQVSLVAPVINLLVVPVMSAIIIPATVLGFLVFMVLPDGYWLGEAVLTFCGKSLNGLMALLYQTDQWFGDYVSQSFSLSGLSLVLGIIVLLCAIPRFPGRTYLLLVSVLSWSSLLLLNIYQSDYWQIHFFDVGQGNATLLSRHRQAILIDTGASFASGFNFADAVLIPYLRNQQLQLDSIMISHFDNDHAGGLAALQAAFPAAKITTPQDECVAGFHQSWLALDIEVLWPPVGLVAGISENNASCVVKISDGIHSVLLAGDIETYAEQQLVKKYQDETLAATVLLAPHHGSKTSSSSAFVKQVNPRYVVFSQGWLNRWGFPHQQVMKRYVDINATPFLISKTGYLQFKFTPLQLNYSSFRHGPQSKWFHKTFSN